MLFSFFYYGSTKEDRTHDSIAKPLYGLLGEVFELRGMFKWVRRSFMTFVELTFGSNINRYAGFRLCDLCMLVSAMTCVEIPQLWQ